MANTSLFSSPSRALYQAQVIVNGHISLKMLQLQKGDRNGGGAQIFPAFNPTDFTALRINEHTVVYTDTRAGGIGPVGTENNFYQGVPILQALNFVPFVRTVNIHNLLANAGLLQGEGRVATLARLFLDVVAQLEFFSRYAAGPVAMNPVEMRNDPSQGGTSSMRPNSHHRVACMYKGGMSLENTSDQAFCFGDSILLCVPTELAVWNNNNRIFPHTQGRTGRTRYNDDVVTLATVPYRPAMCDVRSALEGVNVDVTNMRKATVYMEHAIIVQFLQQNAAIRDAVIGQLDGISGALTVILRGFPNDISMHANLWQYLDNVRHSRTLGRAISPAKPRDRIYQVALH